MNLRAVALVALLAASATACPRKPPTFPFPTARDALERARETQKCSRGLSGAAEIYVYQGIFRVRGKMMYIAMLPDRVRIDVYSPFGAIISTLTSDGDTFQLYDAREGRFFYGPAEACNLARFTGVPLPPHALVELLDGRAPVLAHEPAAASIVWEDGIYVIRITSKHEATEEIRLEPVDEDWDKPWEEQRVHVRNVIVSQGGYALYEAELGGYESVPTAKPRVDPDGLEAAIPTSGPPCDADVPTFLSLVVPDEGHDLELNVEEAEHNPPLLPGVFAQNLPANAEYVTCGPASPPIEP